MRRALRLSVIGILSFSALLVAISSSIISPRGAPDERHHYSYVQYVARHPLDFPPHYERIRTDTAESANHLVHPPLYYQLMAVPYRIANIDEQLTAEGREADRYGAVSGVTAIPVLRSASFLLFLVHLVGFYLLVRRLVTTRVLPGWGAVLATACLSLVPGFLYVAGTLNNDVLSLAVWPFLALTGVRYLQDQQTRDLWRSVGLAAVAILTKATLWPMALVAGAALSARLFVDVRGDGRRWATALWERLRPEGVGWVTAGLAAIAVLAVVTHLGVNLARYGAIQPHYLAVYDIPAEESRFYAWGDPSTPHIGLVGVIGLVFEQSAKSLFGVLGQFERIYPANTAPLLWTLTGITVLAVVAAAWRLRDRLMSDPHIYVPAGMLAVMPLFLAVYVDANHGLYERYGYIGAQGRYFIGYVDLWLIGVVALLWQTARSLGSRSRLARWGGTSVVGVVGALLFMIFVHPLFFLDRTSELHLRAEVPQLVDERARDEGLRRLDLSPMAPDRFVEKGRVEDSETLPAPHLLMAWDWSTVGGPLPPGQRADCLELLVYAKGDRAWGTPAFLDVMLGEGGKERLARVVLHDRIETVRAMVDVPPPSSTERVLLRHANASAPGPPILGDLWPRGRNIRLFGAYGRWTDCDRG